MSNDANKGYQFTVINGAVTAVYEIKNGRAKFEKMDRDETWTVDGANIVKTESEHGRIETRTYRVVEIPQALKENHNWCDLKTVIEVLSQRELKG